MPFRAVVAQSLLLAVLVTWPMALHPTAAVLGSPQGDAIKHVWNLWWMHRELVDGDWGLHTSLINFPAGIDLYPIELVNGLVTAWLPLPPVLTANLLALLHVTLVGVTTGWLGWLVARRARAALVAAALAQGGAFTAFTLHAGVGELRQAWWIPLGLGCAIKARDLLRPRDFIALGLTLAAATLACFYHGFFLATAVAVYALCTPARTGRLWAGWALAAGLGLALVVPLVTLFADSYGGAGERPEMGFFAWMGSGLPTASYLVDSLQITELVTPDFTTGTDYGQHFEAYLGGRYVGVAAVGLGVAGVVSAPRRAWPWAAIALTGVVLALGNTLWFNDKLVEPTVLLPLAVINKALAWFAEPLNFPVRFLAITSTALAVLGGLASRWNGALFLVPVVLLDTAWNDPVPFPRATFALEGRDDLRAPPGAVAELTWATHADAIDGNQDPLTLFDEPSRKRSTAAQLFLDRPFQTVAIERVDHWAPDGIVWTAANPVARALAGTRVERPALQAGVALLRARGFGSILLTHPCDGERDLTAVRILTEVVGPPRTGACADLFPLPVQPPPDDLAAWEATVEADAAKVPRAELGELTESRVPAGEAPKRQPRPPAPAGSPGAAPVAPR